MGLFDVKISTVLAAVGLTLLFCVGAQAQCPGASDAVTASSTQPAITDSPETIDPGVLEIENGWSTAWPGGGVSHGAAGALVKLGVFCNVEFRAYFGGWQSQTFPGQPSVSGTGDAFLTGQYRFHRETHVVPTLAFHYTYKVPTASAGKGLGSGQADQIFSVSTAKTIKHTLFNAESKWIVLGKGQGRGSERYEEYSANLSRGIGGKFALTAEFYGDTKTAGQPAFASSLTYISYGVSPRLVFDAGVDMGITNDAPSRRVFGGVTYAVGNLYQALRHHPAAIQP